MTLTLDSMKYFIILPCANLSLGHINLLRYCRAIQSLHTSRRPTIAYFVKQIQIMIGVAQRSIRSSLQYLHQYRSILPSRVLRPANFYRTSHISPGHRDEYPKNDRKYPVSSSAQAATEKRPRASSTSEPLPTDQASVWNIANAVTTGRLIAAPLTAYWIICESYDFALGALVFAGISDWLDGVLARRLNLRTVLGSYMDPLADKLLVSCATLSLAYQDVLPPWLAALIVSRDVVLMAGSTYLVHRKLGLRSWSLSKHGLTDAVEPFFISKVNTALQISLSFAGVICASNWELITPENLLHLGHVTAVTTGASAAMYGYEFFRLR